MLKIKLMYKIHCLRTANGIYHSAGNDTFYETEEEARQAAASYANDGGSNTSYVIYKAHILVRKEHPPAEVLAIEDDGCVVPLCERHC